MKQGVPKEIIKIKVRWFAEIMREKLEKHLDRSGWEDKAIDWLFLRLLEEVAELAEELFNKPQASEEKVNNECADVANFVMMIADVYEKSASR